MAYIGTKPTVGNFQICDAISVVNGQAAYTMQVGSVNVIPQSANHMIVSLNGVIQKPNSSFTVSGSTITFSSNLATGDVIDFIQILGDVLDLGVPSDGTVTSAKLASQDITFSEDIILGDSKNAIFGAGSDLKIFHNGSNSFVKDVGSGALILDSNGTDVRITKSDAEFMAKFVTDGAVELYYDNSKKIETTSTGATVSGQVLATAGAASAPTYAFDNDTDTGISRPTTNALNFVTAGTERMRIQSNGQVLIQATSNTGNERLNVTHSGNSVYGILINSTDTSGTVYHMSFNRGGTQAGYLVSQSTSVNLANASDERLKENIENSSSAIQDIKDLKVRQFDWKDNIDTHKDFGFVAQELHSIIPEAVSVGSDELDDNGKPKQSWGVDYSHIVPRLVKAVQEQQTKIEELEARITELENA